MRDLVKSTRYDGTLEVDFETHLAKVIVRPDTRLSRAISNPWLKVLLMITLIYPLILLFQYFHPRGKGQWTVAGSAYALRRPRTSEDFNDSKGKNDGGSLIGMTERMWYTMWADTIRSLVLNRHDSPKPIYEPIPSIVTPDYLN